ncbi:UbiH/UbiF/VisC/COQ6 family ubiquinone biosynthesis hydroxylase [Rickettsiella endosymbiont of Litargus connexus]|jgi:2-octaprenylphenol hydroxylase|uniref:UbiH/UbiF/VisC/COQ6 family ubiquinone biosynthesis hydroxylase n=1 Tax=Rickettsiella endosymbiont of Litargus connexus TaxID=3066237 RepID=UPI00376EBAED|nr:UbiH/UbiF/VisC/COQ6 family ubiquinone biosynthesis hydroxylase [Gammaproteobacteria bacterium]
MTLEVQTDYDIVIVGGGIVGLTLACHLKDQDLKIALINKDTSPNISSSLTSQLRVIAITLGSQHYLQELNVWQRFNRKHDAPFRSMQVWESGQAAHLFFDSADIGQASLGYIVKNYDLEQALHTQAKTNSELTWFTPDALVDMQIEKNQVVVTLASGGEISTRLLVGADGEQSKVRQWADLPIKATDYVQRALIATVQTELTHDQIARQVFLANGPLAFLPLRDAHQCSIVWSNTPEEIRRLEALNDELFCGELTKVFEQCLGQIASTSPRLSYPLKIQEAEQYIKSSVALIGDAAHTLHPLAGQGANLGLADAQCLAKVIIEAKQKHRSISAFHTLRRYERERRFHNRVMMGGVDSIKYLFAASNPILQKTRQYGLGLINNLACLKNVITRYAIGNFSG